MYWGLYQNKDNLHSVKPSTTSSGVGMSKSLILFIPVQKDIYKIWKDFWNLFSMFKGFQCLKIFEYH